MTSTLLSVIWHKTPAKHEAEWRIPDATATFVSPCRPRKRGPRHA
jgi:hypothetical protein